MALRLRLPRPAQQRLAGSGWSNQKNALGDACAEPAVVIWGFEKVDDLLELRLGLLDPGDVGEGNAGLLLDVDLGA